MSNLLCLLVIWEQVSFWLSQCPFRYCCWFWRWQESAYMEGGNHQCNLGIVGPLLGLLLFWFNGRRTKKIRYQPFI